MQKHTFQSTPNSLSYTQLDKNSEIIFQLEKLLPNKKTYSHIRRTITLTL